MENVLDQMVVVADMEMTVAAVIAELESNQTRLAEVLEANEVLELQVEELKSGGKKSQTTLHKNNELCIELLAMLERVPAGATVTRHKREYPLITESEQHLLEAFKSTDYNIKQTGEVYGCSHTNVWQRLYGNNKSAIGLIGKLRNYFAEVDAQAEAQPVVEEVTETVEEIA